MVSLRGYVSKKIYIVSMIITIIGIIVTAVVSPYMAAYFAEKERTKPDVYIVEEKCAIVPLWGTELVAFKGVIKNKGSSAEESILVRIDVSQPYVFNDNNLSTIEKNTGDIPAGQTTTFSLPILAPSVEYLQHASITIEVRIRGKTQVWDSATFSETW